MKAPEGFTWNQRDALKLKCVNCNEIVKADVVDLHNC